MDADKIDIIRTEKVSDFDQACRLRYLAYRSVDAIGPNKGECFKDAYDDLDCTTTYLALQNGKAVGSIRACVRTSEHAGSSTPAEFVYPDELLSKVGRTATLVESNRFVMDPDFKGKALPIHVALFRAITANCIRYSARFIVTAVRENHVRFYQRMVQLSPMSAPKVYPPLNDRFVLLGGDFETYYDAFAKRTPEFRLSTAEVAELAG